MDIVLRISFIFVLGRLCVGFNITPPSPLSTGAPRAFNYTWNLTDAQNSPLGAFVAMLIQPPEGFECPDLDAGGDSLIKIVESFATVQVPGPAIVSSGKFFLTPAKQGIHIVCTHGNLPPGLLNAQGSSGISDIFKNFKSLNLLDQSNPFDVSLPTRTSSANSTSTSVSGVSFSPTPSKDSDDSGQNDDHDGKGRGHHGSGKTTGVVGGILGAVALIFIILAILLYRRLRYQRKLNQFHKEHMLLQQQPPSTFLSSITPVQRVTSSPIPGILAPLSPISTMNRRSDIPMGFEETMLTQKGPYQFSSDNHLARPSPPSYSVALPHKPLPMFPTQHHTPD
ncbi:hypothetical protein E1B28_008086 [Marasmius oreades]|uniref:Uncharacterized protein n=1 Tax=Marasmius oreades TaxID=181124 RepID=A0A9P7UUG1_9AGAR|nr:uncharacterized protein E1B28_008086 [Marasmius oreades]KAG7094488.1 hypothetical protein E1B28_008086 [Marasmius oreades]